MVGMKRTEMAWVFVAGVLVGSGCYERNPHQGDEDGTGSAADTDPAPTSGSQAEAGHDDADDADDDGTDTSLETGDGQPAVCGNGVVEGDEVCDDGVNDGSYGGCSEDCSGLGPHCGDGEENGAEQCDLGDENGGADCNTHCQVPGTVLATLHDTIDLSSLGVPASISSGIRATLWNGNITAVFGGFGTTVWEVEDLGDGEGGSELETLELRLVDLSPDQTLMPLRGALGLENGSLLVAAENGKRALLLDSALSVQWAFDTSEPAVQQGFVGVAALPGGAFLGAIHRNFNPSSYSAYWVAGIDEQGDPSWSAIEQEDTTSNIAGRDLVGLADGRAVLLAVGAANEARFRIYDSTGDVIANETISNSATSAGKLCRGDQGFFVMNEAGTALVGYGADGSGLPGVSIPAPPGNPAFVTSGCATRSDNSPVVAYNAVAEDDSSTLHVIGYAGGRQIWTTQPDNRASTLDAPTFYLEEELGRAWVFSSGMESDQVRFVYVALVAI